MNATGCLLLSGCFCKSTAPYAVFEASVSILNGSCGFACYRTVFDVTRSFNSSNDFCSLEVHFQGLSFFSKLWRGLAICEKFLMTLLLKLQNPSIDRMP